MERETGAVPEPAVIPAQFAPTPFLPRFLFQRPPVLPKELGPPLRRISNQSGKEAGSDTPSWAHGTPRHANENPALYAERVRNEKWGLGQWRGIPDRMQEHGQIKKYGQRAFENPRGVIGLDDDGA